MIRKLLSLVALIVSLTVYALAAPFGYAAFALWSATPTSDREARTRSRQRILHRAFRLVHRWGHFARLLDSELEVEGEPIPAGPCVLVANHPSLLDVTTVVAAVDGVVTFVRADIFRAWWMRPLLSDAGLIGAPDTEPAAVERAVSDAVSRLEKGFRMLIFPEGTRSPHGELRPFGRIAFEIACRADVPIVPIFISVDPPWLSKEVPFMRHPDRPSRVRLHALPALYPADHHRSSRGMRDAVHSALKERLGTDRVNDPG